MAKFDYFVLFAEMRTGSNFLEANLNLFDGVACLGEAFNPHFIGYPDRNDVLGITQPEREADPQALIDAVKDAPGLNGFRFFHDHDARVLDIALTDPRCAKIVLTRNPADSFVSWKIATQTGQWKLTNATHAKTGQVTFDADEFDGHLAGLQDFQVRILNTLQRTGQTAFYVAYEDLQDVEIMNGLATWLGVEAQITALDKKLKKQNPMPMAEKVQNFEEMSQALARADRFNLTRTPNFEPRRGPLIPTWVAAARSPLLYMPLKSGPTAAVEQWMADTDGVAPSELMRKFSQRSLRDWLRDTPGHAKFTVVRHPVAWAHTAFCERIVANGPGTFAEIRRTLGRIHNVAVPDGGPIPETDATYDMAAHKAAFLAFLKFLRNNLSAQTAVRLDAAWASQSTLLQGMADFGLPDVIVREGSLDRDLAWIAGRAGIETPPPVPAQTDPLAGRLAAIYDDAIERAARDAYGRDYESFGFGDYA
ncbi:nodulation protein NodH [Salipiger sp. IMCC34102]|uniref:sulfotransferase family 2 domain-containing protein n=1 Tax=Salipiger sp. IMCC34102 TaxID=2510647 RepID=UPI00101D9341|nr:sulfotransferase family 2 domain-containing protein [Salipiger sp. IMCC34102]RYH04154.1 nodulation protein NodH [Salipiger sp. IMCC34102]